MKTIWEIILVITFVAIGIFGITAMGDKTFETQTLTAESVETLAIYSSQADAYLNNYSQDFNRSEIDPYLDSDLNDVEGFVQQYRETKGRLDQVGQGILLLYKFPDLFIYILPVVQPEDLGIFVDAYRTLVWLLILLIFLAALNTSNLLPQY